MKFEAAAYVVEELSARLDENYMAYMYRRGSRQEHDVLRGDWEVHVRDMELGGTPVYLIADAPKSIDEEMDKLQHRVRLRV